MLEGREDETSLLSLMEEGERRARQLLPRAPLPLQGEEEDALPASTLPSSAFVRTVGVACQGDGAAAAYASARRGGGCGGSLPTLCLPRMRAATPKRLCLGPPVLHLRSYTFACAA